MEKEEDQRLQGVGLIHSTLSRDGRQKGLFLIEPRCIFGECPVFDRKPALMGVKALEKYIIMDINLLERFSRI